MSEPTINTRSGHDAPSPTTSAGAMLRAAREATGLSVDTVAQQLKLAPRQVMALEDDDYTHLPGRTFVRGFVRNYARFLRLDADTVLGALPAGAATPALASPTLHQTAPTMGELPVTDHARPGIARWVIPLTLATIVAAAGLYEWLRPAAESRPGSTKGPGAAVERAAPPAPAASATPSASDASPAATPPPASPPSAPGAPASSPAAPAPIVQPPTPAPVMPPSLPTPAGQATPLPNPLATARPATPEPAVAASPAATSAGAAPVGGATVAADAPKLVLAFRDYSWTEVRDRQGRVLLSRMNSGGTTQALAGMPPLDLVIGNASDVSLTWRGKPVDLAPYTRQNVARFTLP